MPVRFPRTGGPVEECRNPARQPLAFSFASTCQGTVTDSEPKAKGGGGRTIIVLMRRFSHYRVCSLRGFVLGGSSRTGMITCGSHRRCQRRTTAAPLPFGNTYAVKLCPRATPSYWAMRSASCCGKLSGRTWGRNRRTRKGRKGGRMRRPLGPSWGDLEAVLGVS